VFIAISMAAAVDQAHSIIVPGIAPMAKGFSYLIVLTRYRDIH